MLVQPSADARRPRYGSKIDKRNQKLSSNFNKEATQRMVDDQMKTIIHKLFLIN